MTDGEPAGVALLTLDPTDAAPLLERVTEVANELDIHKSTAYRLLTTLRDRGLVEQDATTEKYRLGCGLVVV